jgi:hypothetical protein
MYLRLEELINKYITPENLRTNNEFEFRFGTYDNIFKATITKDMFYTIAYYYKNDLLIKPDNSFYLNVTTNNKRVQLLDNTRKQILEFANSNMITSSMNYKIMKKSRLETDDELVEYGLRFAISAEEDMTNLQMLRIINNELQDKNKVNTYRQISRNSFIIVPGLRLDLSRVKSANGLTYMKSNIQNAPEEYEVELEIYNTEDYTDNFNKLILTHLYKLFLLLNGGITFTTINEKKKIKQEYNNLIGSNIHAQNVIFSHESIDMKTFDKSKYVYVDKADGERHLLFINTDGNSYLINNKEEIFKTDIMFNDNPGKYSLFDGELIYDSETNKYEYHIFDLLFLHSTDYRELKFYNENEISLYIKEFDKDNIIINKPTLKEYNYYAGSKLIDEFSLDNFYRMNITRSEMVESFEPKTRYGNILKYFKNEVANEQGTLKILYKSFYPLLNLYKNTKDFNLIRFNSKTQTINIPKKSYKLDGLIIQLKEGQYPIQTEVNKNPQWNDSYKWKFPINITIDFKIKNITLNSSKTAAYIKLADNFGNIYVNQELQLNNGRLLTNNNHNISENDIVECNLIEDKWNIIKIRYDKNVPNAPKTIQSNLNLIKNPIMIEELI